LMIALGEVGWLSHRLLRYPREPLRSENKCF
jgi:hypothetical protein